jgi:putative oxidoreductase
MILKLMNQFMHLAVRQLISHQNKHTTMKATVLIGRILFTAHFLFAAPFHFTPASITWAESAGVPMASFLVPLSGVLALVGGLGVLLGSKAKLAAWLLIIFLIPVNFAMHQFWSITDQQQQQMMMSYFLKDLSMTGGAFIIAYFGAGPLSIDAWMATKRA